MSKIAPRSKSLKNLINKIELAKMILESLEAAIVEAKENDITISYSEGAVMALLQGTDGNKVNRIEIIDIENNNDFYLVDRILEYRDYSS